MRHLLDTHSFIAALKGRSEVRTRLQRLPLADLLLSPVVLGNWSSASREVRGRNGIARASPTWCST